MHSPHTFANTLRRIARKLLRRPQYSNIPTHPFDLTHGVDTSGLIAGADLATANNAHITAYWGTAPSLFSAAITHWANSLPAIPNYTFLDIGCGKGRVAMLASNYPFHQIIGIEIDTQLIAIARQNLTRWQTTPHACNNVVLIHEDVLSAEIPPTPILLYLFNPFDAHILQRLLDRLQTLTLTRPAIAPIDILYVHPAHADLFDNITSLHRLWDGYIPLTPEDTAADFDHCQGERCCIYRLLPPTKH